MGRLRRLLAAVDAAVLVNWRLNRRLRSAVPAELATIEDNTFARVTGTVRPLAGHVLTAPLSGRSCVYYSIEVYSMIGSFRTTIGGAQAATPFQLVDPTGHAVVDPGRALFSVAVDHQSRSKAAFDADPEQRRVLEQLELVHRNWFNTTGLLYAEGAIVIGERVSVLGAGVREPDPDGAPVGMYRDQGPTRMRFAGTRKSPLVISDDPKSR